MLTEWARQWGVSVEALVDLRQRMGVNTDPPPPPHAGATSEMAVQNMVRLELTRIGGRAFRNNVGAAYTTSGGFLRYGLCNDTAQLNRVLKSSDLIGINPVIITGTDVGRTMGQFVAREIKKPGWKWHGTDREIAQLNFLQLIASLGGDASFCCGPGSFTTQKHGRTSDDK